MTTRQLKDRYVTQTLVRFTQNLMAGKASHSLLMAELAGAFNSMYNPFSGMFNEQTTAAEP